MKDGSSELLVKKVVDELARLRKEQGLSHQSLADKIGMTRPAISLIESHDRQPRLLTCDRMARALGVRLSDIIRKFED